MVQRDTNHVPAHATTQTRWLPLQMEAGVWAMWVRVWVLSPPPQRNEMDEEEQDENMVGMEVSFPLSGEKTTDPWNHWL